MIHYSAYGLSIRSEIELTELPPAAGGADFDIRLDRQAKRVERRSIEWVEGPPASARFDYPSLGTFEVRGGRELIITPDDRGDSTLFRLYVEGMMLATALYQRGYFVLHASVVDLGGSAIAFVGPVGAGKSTFATAFQALGYRVAADDNAALDLTGAMPRVLPAFPSLKIYPAVARALGLGISSLEPMHPSQVKQAHAVRHSFSPNPLPLQAIYVLDREAEGAPARINPVQTITELIRHSVPTRWAVAGSARHLRQCGRLAGMAPLFRFRSFRELRQIRELASEIEQHAHPDSAPVPAGIGGN